MKLCISRSKNSTSFYIGESFRDIAGHSTTRIISRIGTLSELQEKLGPEVDVEQWAKNYVKELNAKKKAEKQSHIKLNLELEVDSSYEKGEKRSLNVGYMFLRRVLYSLGFEQLTDDISRRYKFNYNYSRILADLIYARILEPTSKLGSYYFSNKYLYEEPDYKLHDVYRALDVTVKENDFIQSSLYKLSSRVIERNTEILYYDCTNFYFEISVADGLKQYGASKEHRPNPIVQMGLFMDGSGIPLAFNINPGNRNEQITMIPLEKQIIKDFELADAGMTICADAGLCSAANKKFNSTMKRNFIVIRPIKTMAVKLQEWVLDHGRSLTKLPIQPGENPNLVYKELELNGWRCDGIDGYISLDDIDENDPDNLDRIFYKEKYLILDEKSGKTERLIITYSIKYKRFMENKRKNDLKRADKLIKQKLLKKSDLKKTNDVTRYIKVTNTTARGEVALNTSYEIDIEEIKRQRMYDGFYAVSTSFDKEMKSAAEIAKINHGRWEIEESFRLLKTEFRARPVFLQTDDRIRAHFIICFMALLVFRTLEKMLNTGREHPFTAHNIISELRGMYVTPLDKHFTGSFARTDLTDALQGLMEMKFDCQLITNGLMRRNLRQSKKILEP